MPVENASRDSRHGRSSQFLTEVRGEDGGVRKRETGRAFSPRQTTGKKRKWHAYPPQL